MLEKGNTNNGTKYFYYFNAFSHVGKYISWVEEARSKGLDLQMVSFVPIHRFVKGDHRANSGNDKEFIHIYPSLPFNFPLVHLIFFSLSCIFNDRIVVYCHKQNPLPLRYLKMIFGDNNVRLGIRIEGDVKLESEYLRNNPYKEGFYDGFHKNAEKKAKSLEEQLRRSDGVSVVTEELKDKLDERHQEINIRDKTTVLPTGTDFGIMHISDKTRIRKRDQLGINHKFVIIYIGNVHYSWQNIHRTMEIFKLMKNNLSIDPYLILLVRENDHDIIHEFVDNVGISQEDYYLQEVPYSEVNDYLNAADMGVMLRDDHEMNYVSDPGKYGEYLATGLPVLTTPVARYSEELDKEYGIVLENMENDTEVLSKIRCFINDNVERTAVRNWGKDKFSIREYGEQFVNFLRNM